MFTKTELEVMAKLLELASDQFSNHGCNDFELPNTPQNVALLKKVNSVTGDDSDPVAYNNGLCGNDSALMQYFQGRCEEEAERLEIQLQQVLVRGIYFGKRI